MVSFIIKLRANREVPGLRKEAQQHPSLSPGIRVASLPALPQPHSYPKGTPRAALPIARHCSTRERGFVAL